MSGVQLPRWLPRGLNGRTGLDGATVMSIPLRRLLLLHGLLVVALVSSMVPAPVEATHFESRSLRPAEPVRELQRDWITGTFFDLRNQTIRHDFPDEDARNLSRQVNASLEDWRDDRWRQVHETLIGARVNAAVLRIDQAAARSDDPSQVWLDRTGSIAVEANEDLQDLRTRITERAGNTTDPVEMEVLLLASTLLVDGMENIRVHPQYRQIVSQSGNETPSSIFRQLAATAVSARWDARYARDLVETADEVGTNGSASVDPAKLEEAWRTMEEAVDLDRPQTQASRALREGLNRTTEQEEWLLSVSLGSAYATAEARHSIRSSIEEGTTAPDDLAERTREWARDIGTVVALQDMGYRGTIVTSTLREADAVLRADEPDLGRLVLAQARLESGVLLADALEVLATASDGGDGTDGGDGGGNLLPGAGAATAGLALAGAALLARDRRRW